MRKYNYFFLWLFLPIAGIAQTLSPACGQGNTRDSLEGALLMTTNDSLIMLADDFYVPAGDTITFKTIETKILASKYVNSMSFTFYSDNNGQPGTKVLTADSIVPYSQTYLGGPGYYLFDIFTAVNLQFTGGTSGQTYWMQPHPNLEGNGIVSGFSFWCTTPQTDSTGLVHASYNHGQTWHPQQDSVQGIFTLYCEHITDVPGCDFAITDTVEPITRVLVTSEVLSDTYLNHYSDTAINGSPGLEIFDETVINAMPLQTISIAVEGNTNGNHTNYVTIFIDWFPVYPYDIFDVDTLYQIGTLQNSNGVDGQQVTDTFQLPAYNMATALIRILKTREEYVTDPCGHYPFGQAEDYYIKTGEIGVEKHELTDFSFYPNPVKNTVVLNSRRKMKKVTVYNLLGQQVLVETNLKEGRINVASLARGLYFFRVSFKNGLTKTIKIVKE